MIKIDQIKCAFFYFFLLVSTAVCAQVDSVLYALGHSAYDRDLVDSAMIYYEELYRSNDYSWKLMAAGSLIKTKIFLGQRKGIDSLINEAESGIYNEASVESQCRYDLQKSFYYLKTSRIRKAIQHGLRTLNKVNNNDLDQLLVGQVNQMISESYQGFGQADSSVIFIERAYAIYEKKLDSTDLRLNQFQNAMASTYFHANRLELAEEYYMKAIQGAKVNAGPMSSTLSLPLGNLANIYSARGEHKEAVGVVEDALKINSFHKDELSAAFNYRSLGIEYYYLGDYGRALEYLNLSLDIRKRLLSPNHQYIGSTHQVLGHVFAQAGFYNKAFYHYKLSHDNEVINYGFDNVYTGYGLENLALMQQSTSKSDSALLLIKQANQIFTKYLEDDDSNLASNFYSYSSILNDLGNYKEAELKINRALSIDRNVQPDTTIQSADIYTLAGVIQGNMNQWKKGQDYFNVAIDLVQGNSEFILSQTTASVLDTYISFLFSKYEQSADTSILDELERMTNEYLNVAEEIRRKSSDPFTKSAVSHINSKVYKRHIEKYIKLYDSSKNNKYLKTIFRFSELGKASIIRDLLDIKVEQYAGVPDSILSRENELKSDVMAHYLAVQAAPKSDSARLELLKVHKALDKFTNAMAADYPDYYDLKYNSDVIGLAEVMSKRKDKDFVTYMSDDEDYYAMVMTADASEVFRLGAIRAIDSLVSTWLIAVQRLNAEGSRVCAEQLYAYIWKPFHAALSSDQIVVVPDGRLNYVSFEALQDEESHKPLIYEKNISYALSLTTFFHEGKTNERSVDVLSVAPGFSDEIKTDYKNAADSFAQIDEQYLRTVRQPWSLALAEKLDDLIQGDALLGHEATEASVKSKIQDIGVIHLATHAILSPYDPFNSKFILAKGIENQLEDGYLHAHEIFGLKLNAELAILGACQSGLGQLRAGEGMMSLAYSMAYAGCPSTTMTLWSVDEKTNTMILEDFILNLAHGMSKSESLRQAKLNYLATASDLESSPYYWAGTVLKGQDGFVSVRKRSYTKWIGLLLGLILFSASLLHFFKKKSK